MHLHVPGRQSRPGISACPLVVMDSCLCRDTELKVALRATTDQDPTMVPSGTTVRLFLTLFKSSVLSSFYPILLFLFLLYFSTTYLLLLVAPGVSECLGSSQQWSQRCYAPFKHNAWKFTGVISGMAGPLLTHVTQQPIYNTCRTFKVYLLKRDRLLEELEGAPDPL